MILRAVLVICGLLFVGCSDSDANYNISPDPYPGRIDSLANELELTPAFADRFRKDYLRRVSTEVGALNQEGDPDDYRIEVHLIRSYTFYNMWGEEGVDIMPPSTFAWSTDDQKNWRDRMAELTSQVQEYEIEIAILRARVEGLEAQVEVESSRSESSRAGR